MAIISLIAAIDENRGLGLNNQLLCHLPADLKHFKDVTMGKPIIMGRKTYESIGKPLPGRTNIVLSHTGFHHEGIIVFDSLYKAISYAHKDAEIMIIGGAAIFAQAIGRANRLYITKVHQQFHADVFFPEISEKIWDCNSERFRPQDEQNKFSMTFLSYERIHSK